MSNAIDLSEPTHPTRIGGDVSLKDQFIGMKNISCVGTVLVGHTNESFSLEELTSSKNLTCMGRSRPSILDSARNFGLAFRNHYLDKTSSGVSGRVTPNKPFNPEAGDWGAWQIAERYSWIDL